MLVLVPVQVTDWKQIFKKCIEISFLKWLVVSVKCAIHQRIVGGVLIWVISFLKLWAQRWKYQVVGAAWPVLHHTYGYLPSLCQYQIILLGDRSTCVNNLPRVAVNSAAAGIWTCDLFSCKSSPLATRSSHTVCCVQCMCIKRSELVGMLNPTHSLTHFDREVCKARWIYCHVDTA